MRIVQIVFLTIAVICIGLYAATFFVKDRVTSEQVRTAIKHDLAPGASAQEIEMFFARYTREYGYDKFHNEYHAIIRNISRYSIFDPAIEIDIYVDDEKRYVRSEVYVWYSFL